MIQQDAQAPPQGRAWIGLLLLLLAVMAGSQWWVSHSRDSLGQTVASAARAGDIQMLSSTSCGICTQARRWFQEHRVRFDECFIETDADCAARFQRSMAPGTPLIVVRGQGVLGFDPQRIAALLRAQEPAAR